MRDEMVRRHAQEGRAARTIERAPVGSLRLSRPGSTIGVDMGVPASAQRGAALPAAVRELAVELLSSVRELSQAMADHLAATVPELAAEGTLHAFLHHGLWLTVNTAKDLRRAEDYLASHPEWLAADVV